MRATKEIAIRATAAMVAVLLALGMGLAGTTGSNAAPIGGATLLNAIEDASLVWRSRYPHSRRHCGLYPVFSHTAHSRRVKRCRHV